MKDLNEELRELFRRRVTDVDPPHDLPSEVIRRARRRQIRTIVAGGLVALIVAAGSFVGARAVLDQRPDDPLGEPPTPRYPELSEFILGDRAVIATGTVLGRDWELAVWQHPQAEGRWCVSVSEQPGSTDETSRFDCARRGGLPAGQPVAIRDEETFGRGQALRKRIIGQVERSVTHLEIELQDGRTLRPEIIAPPDEYADLGGFFVLVLDEDASGTAWAVHADGNRVGAAGF